MFATIEEAQAQLDAWVAFYNAERPHQVIGMVPPEKRFASAHFESFQPVLPQEDEEPYAQPRPHGPRAIRKVSLNGRMRLAGADYNVGRFLGGETVEAEFGPDGLVSIFHRGVLVATFAGQHRPGAEQSALRRRPHGSGIRRQTSGTAVLRQVDSRGDLSLAGTAYRAGLALAVPSSCHVSASTYPGSQTMRRRANGPCDKFGA